MRRGSGALVVGFVAFLGVFALLGTLLGLPLFINDDVESCNGPDVSLASPSQVESLRELSEPQLANAATIIGVGYRLGVSRKGIVVALAVAHQESGFLNYANDGRGGDLIFLQAGIEDSLGLPHQAVGSDHGSLGVFQQQWPWWGSMEELMDPAKAAEKFYRALLKVRGWESMRETAAGQAVQISAYPDAYADDVPLAEALLADPATAGAAEVTSASLESVSGGCLLGDMPPGTVTYPLPASSGYIDAHNFGSAGANWSKGHTGTDFSASCGTPVVASTAGTVVIRTDQPWSGRWLVQVSTGIGRLTTWYGHMQSLTVEDGDQVQPDDQIGTVGSEGNSTGCHLHFEVHSRGGSIYEDGIDPSQWLRENAGHELEDPGLDPDVDQAGAYTLATFNVLGHSHTKPGGNKPGWASSQERMRATVQLLDEHAIDVIGFQELQPIQAEEFRRLAGSTYELHSPPGDTENSIAFRTARFEFVAADTVAIPYFNGRIRQMPIVRLRDRTTNQDSIFINVHNPANTSRFPNQAAHRAEAVRRQVELVRSLRQRYAIPTFLTGDLNDRRDAFCGLTAGGVLAASAGGNGGSSCSPPADAGIDWILGSPDVRLIGHESLSAGIRGEVSDHPLVTTSVIPTGGVR
ncbi:peptidoglycan DD-metalloendopeptidase family protein [Nocardioides iriomotensis]|uniref:M23 family metallopeptidase n=1 Tax=Nocardioides iriomotensis TaxID=715784 RepID=A0A4Q5J8D4_9ACTN|nr:peptidoglycan DD-metalloendopeptidase family protein [Nocardioides iriomotensis]RYU14793.1 hypothetical protein ETU37_02050 [Nocardioides iriomotensis]